MAIFDNMQGKAAIIQLQDNTPTKTASGSNISITDSANCPFVDLEVFGQSVQDGTPTPDSPVDIENVVISGIKTCGKNIVDFGGAFIETGATCSFDEGTNTFNVAYNGKTARVSLSFNKYAGKTITFTCKSIVNDNESATSSVQMVIKHSSGSTTYPNLLNESVEIPLDCQSASFRIYGNTTSTSLSGNLTIVEPMVRIVGTSDTYEPYKETSITLSEPITIRGIGEVQDQIVKQDGAWGVIRNVGEVTYDGSESWKTSARSDGSTYYAYLHSAYSGISASGTELLSNIGVSSSCYSQGEGAQIYNSQVNAYAENYNTSDVSLWTSYLAENPLTIVYELATPTFEKLPDADQQALNELETFNPFTNVIFDSTIAPEINLEYVNVTFEEPVKMLAEKIAKVDNYTEISNGSESYSGWAFAQKYGRLIVLSFKNITPLDLATFLNNNGAILNNAGYIYANINLLIAGTYAGIAELSIPPEYIAAMSAQEMFNVMYYPSSTSSNFVNSDNDSASMTGTITYISSNYDKE